jgi:hypothetical protein
MRAVKGHFRPPSGEEWGKGRLDNLVSMFVCIYRCDAREGVRSFLCSRSARPPKGLARRPQSKASHSLAWLTIELE